MVHFEVFQVIIFKKRLYFFVFLIFTNSVGPDEMQHGIKLHFIWVVTVCKSTRLVVSPNTKG